jgi:hypothetical protein
MNDGGENITDCLIICVKNKLFGSVKNCTNLCTNPISIIVPVYKKGDRNECNHYRGLSLLSTSYKMLSKILL